MDRGAWQATVHSIAKSRTQLSNRTELSSPGFPAGLVVKNPPANAGDRVRSLGHEDPLEKELEPNSSIPVWRIPWTEEPGGLLQSMGVSRSGHEWVTKPTYLVPFFYYHRVD